MTPEQEAAMLDTPYTPNRYVEPPLDGMAAAGLAVRETIERDKAKAARRGAFRARCCEAAFVLLALAAVVLVFAWFGAN